jgi:hypothetical protein
MAETLPDFGPAEKATAGIMNALRVVTQAAEKWPPVEFQRFKTQKADQKIGRHGSRVQGRTRARRPRGMNSPAFFKNQAPPGDLCRVLAPIEFKSPRGGGLRAHAAPASPVGL